MNILDRLRSMKAYYDRRAPWHDDYMNYTGNENMERLLQPVIDAILPQIVDRNVLELACGTGNWTEVLAKRAGAVLAVDSSPAALRIAQKKLGAYRNVTFKQADAFELTGVTGPFDTAFAADWYSHIPKSIVPSFLNALHKVVKTGCVVILLDMAGREELHKEIIGFDEEGNCISRRTLPDGSVFEVIKNFPTRDELRESLNIWSEKFTYREFQSLQRWMVTCRLK
jgi:ubiquinone/menaquinone biosynthesis C-methylase UbiE